MARRREETLFSLSSLELHYQISHPCHPYTPKERKTMRGKDWKHKMNT